VTENEYTSLSITESTKDDLDDERATGQSWDGCLQELLEEVRKLRDN